MKKLLALVFFFLTALGGFASGDNFSAGARAAAMGDASVTLADVFSTTTNQAGLAYVRQYTVGIFSDRKFLSAAINNFNLGAALPVEKVGTFGISANFYGYKYYNETKIGVAYARAFGEKVALGVQLDYLRFYVFEGGTRQLVTVEAGVQYKPWKVLTLGAHLYNPIPYSIEKIYKERLPTVLKFGLGYEPSRKVLLAVAYQQDIHYKPQFKAGIEYRPLKYVTARAGVQLLPFSASLGFGANVAGLNIDVAGAYHPVLGFTPQLALIYSFKKKKK